MGNKIEFNKQMGSEPLKVPFSNGQSLEQINQTEAKRFI